MLTKRTSWTLDDQILETTEPPIRFIPVVMGLFFAFQIMELEGTMAIMASNLVRSLIAFTIFWALYRTIAPLSILLHKLDSIFSQELVEWMARAIRVLVVVIGAAAVLEVWGIQVGPIIAGFGLIGVAVALGAQDLFKNLIAGLLILAEKRFHKGDWINVDGVVEGHVENIGFRSTMIRRFDKAPVMVPNSQLSDTAVINFTAMTHRRIKWLVGVEYRTTIDQLRQIRDEIAAYIEETPEFAPATEVSTFVRIDSFGDSSINIMIYCFTNTTKWGEWLEIKEKLAYKIMEIVLGAGTAFAFPSQSIYVESLPDADPPEIFAPPAPQTPTGENT
jgi:MscS family membrane protein